MNTILTSFPFLGFIARVWRLLIAVVATNWLANTELHFNWMGKWVKDPELGGIWIPQTPMEFIGPVLWALPIGFGIWILALVAIHMHYRQTIDADTNGGKYLTDWQACSPFQRVVISNFVRIGIFIGFCILCAGLAKGAVPVIDQEARWNAAIVSPKRRAALDVELALYRRTVSRYEVIQNMRPHGVPAPILFCLHMRESDNDFTKHAHEGSSLRHRTVDEPKGRPLHPEPPYTFEQSAYDAYYVYEKPTLDKIDWSDGQSALDKMESFNGFGYSRLGIWSPYLFSGTSGYAAGKYVSDGRFSRSAVDQQLGCVAVLKTMLAHGIKISFVD